MSVNKGGRGKKAPYETTHIRVPLPIKDKVQKIVDDYKDGIENEDSQFLSYDDAVELANNILKRKKGAKDALQKLLTGIYKRDIML